MKVAPASIPAAAICAALALLLVFSQVAGCGRGPGSQGEAEAATNAATAFLNALGERDVDTLRPLMSRDYLETAAVPDPITREHLLAAIGQVNSYRFVPGDDIVLDGERAVITLDIEIAGAGTSEETLVMCREEGEWKVDAFTAMDWSRAPQARGDERVRAEQALRDFLVACMDGDTGHIFEHLSHGYRESRRLEEPWTQAEFSGIFGTARSFDFDPEAMDIEDGTARVDVTVEFGSRGNLESETARVALVKEGSVWLVDTFPFFIY